MAIRYYISTEEASFFINNRMGYANSIPTSGNYKVGDFIISSTQEDGIFGWVCTVAGTPGEWEVIGSGMSNGSVMHDKVVGYINAVSFSDARSSIEIGINEYEKGKDFLEVHYNGLMLAEGVHYNVSEDGKSIIALDEVWNENADDTQQMIFRVIKSEGVNVKELKNTININSACYEVEMGIEGFSPEKDVVEVHLNGVLLVQGVDYEIVEGRISKLDRSEAWNPYNISGQKMFVRLFRNIANLVEPADGSVTMEKLSPDVRSDVAAIDGLVSSMGIQNSTISNLNDRVTAIEEKIESGDIVTNGGGGGGGPVKLSYKDNLVEVVNTNTVAIGLPFNKEKDMLEVHIDGLKLAEGVHYNISEDGTSIVKVEGVWNPDSLEDQYIDFRVISAGNQQIDHLTRNVEFSSPMTEVGIDLEYKHGVDILIVHLNGIKLVEGLDFEYIAEGNKIVKIDGNEPWNLYGVDGQLFVIDVLRNVGEKVTMNDLADDVKQAIEAAGNIDISGKQDKTDNGLITTNKTIVGAINEVENETITIKQSLVDVLNIKGIPCDNNQSWFNLFGLLLENLNSGGGNGSGDGTLLSGQWNEIKSIGTARSNIGVCVCQGKIYCLGGLKGDNTASNLFACYDPSTNNWETLASFPLNIYGAACTANEETGTIYVHFIMDTPNSTSCIFKPYFYNISNNTWNKTVDSPNGGNGTAMPSKAFMINNRATLLDRGNGNLGIKVYTAGTGFDYIYDTNGYPDTYIGSANCCCNNIIYSIGGYIQDLDGPIAQNKIISVDVQKIVSTELSPLPVYLVGASAEVYEGIIYVFGGREKDSATGGSFRVNNNIYVYDINNDTWSTMEGKGIDITYAGTSIIDNKIYVFGGSNGTDISYIPSSGESNKSYVFIIGEEQPTYSFIEGLTDDPGEITLNELNRYGNVQVNEVSLNSSAYNGIAIYVLENPINQSCYIYYQINFENLLDFDKISKITISAKIVRDIPNVNVLNSDNGYDEFTFGVYDSMDPEYDEPIWTIKQENKIKKESEPTEFTEYVLDTRTISGKHKFAILYSASHYSYKDEYMGPVYCLSQLDIKKIKFE